MANMTFKANLLPDNTAAQRELGSSTAKWAINGVADPKLTDTLPTINTTGTGNAITSVSISGSTITVTKGSTFNNYTYTLPTASSSTKGGIKVGSGLSISSETLSVSTSSGTSTLAWGSEVTLGTVGGLAIKAKLPTNPNSNTTYTFANGSDGSFTVTPSGGSAQKVTIGKPATAGTADVANSVAWGSVSGKPSTFPPSSHTHLVTEITQGNAAVAGSLDPLTQSLIGSAASNKSFGLPAEAITIEYSTNGGSTWTDYGATDTQKKALFSETRSFNASLGKATTAAANSVNNQLRITIEPTDRYTSFNGLYIWMSTSGNTVTVDLERSTIGAKNTFTSVFTGQSIAGWSGNNIRYFTYGSFGGGSTQTSNNYKYRLIFKQTAINSNYASASINDIRFLGLNVWSSPNNMVSKNHLYTWNENLDATFPAQITATAFNGNASSSSAVKDYNNSTLTEFGYSTSGMGSTSWLGSWDASTSGKYRLRAISPANAIKSGIGSTAIGAAGTPIYWNGSNFVAGNAAAASGHTHNYLPLSGGTLSGDLSLKTGTADSPDIVWYYGDTSKEQARIWMGSGGTTKFSPLFRCYKSDGTSLYSGNLVLGDGTGASGTWGISITGSAGSATKATQDESGNNIKASYAASFSISDHTITLKNKNGASLGTVTIPDNNTVTTVTTTGTGNAVTAVTATNGAITVTKGSTFVTSSGVTSITAGTGLTTTNGGSTDGGSITTSGTFYLTKSGATAGSYGPSANVSGSNGTTMNVPYITVDAYGRVTSISNKTYTSVNTEGTDTKNTAGSTDISTKIFLVGAASQTASAQTYSDNQVYATNGQLDANKLRVAEQVTLQYNTTTNALDFVFV